VDAFDLDAQPVLEMGAENYEILNRFSTHLGESMKSQKLPDNFLPSPVRSGDPHGHANQAHQS
jgi:hypothetical protein